VEAGERRRGIMSIGQQQQRQQQRRLLKQGEQGVDSVKMLFSENPCQGGGENGGCPVGVFQVPVIFKPFGRKLACAASSIACEHAKISKEHFSFFFSPA
jgi:hypothetical protein